MLGRIRSLPQILVFCVVALWIGFSPSGTAQSPPATLTVDVGRSVHAVSPTLYGLMTEEINYSYDGGLYAEMVRNRAFEDKLAHWNVVHEGESAAVASIDLKDGPSEALPYSVKLELTGVNAQLRAGLRNEGYWGMEVRPATTYTASYFARGESADMGSLRIALVSDQTGAVLASAETPVVTAAWKQYTVSLKSGPEVTPSAENHLEILAQHSGTLHLQMVSLFPPTYHDRPNGNRPDLMEMLGEMHPAFLRLPGGNYLEGDEIDQRFDWKTTLGPLVDRPTHRSPWNYQSTDGMGLLEFLEWTEDLKIEPVLAVYAGYSLKGDHIRPGPALTPFVEDGLDELEFVTGSTSTKWGAVRAKLGHPAPFPLHYVEIGNEDNFDKSGSYEGRYAQFYRAIKAKYPRLQLIATMPLKNMKPDVVDDHFYRRSDQFFEDTQHYDKTDRSGPKIFVGEWATREGSPTTNLGAALGDAAWMTGMERNSDIVVLASYAPLFVNVNPGGMQWESNLIGYDAQSSYGSPGYYAQVLFAKYLGTEVPVSSMEGGGRRFSFSCTSSPKAGELYVKLVNGSSEAQVVDLRLNGVKAGVLGGAVYTISGASPAETNTIRDPRRIVPQESEIAGSGATLHHTMPPYSVQVMVLHVR